jgi:hypothetical protein
MLEIVQDVPHTHVSRGNAGMDKPSKELKFGNTTVIVYSNLVTMTSDERRQWYKNEWEKGNPVLKKIAEAMDACYMD